MCTFARSLKASTDHIMAQPRLCCGHPIVVVSSGLMAVEEPPLSKIVTFRLDGEVWPRVDAYAARTRRSRNAAMLYLIERGLDYEAEHNPENMAR